MMMIRQADGAYIQDPNEQPIDLITVHDVYGHRYRVRAAHLDDTSKAMLPLYTNRGVRLAGTKENFGRRLLCRENLAMTP